MRSFLECKKEISFYMKELTLFELDGRDFPSCGNCLSALILSYRVLFHSHSDILLILGGTYIFFIQRILLADVQRFIPNG